MTKKRIAFVLGTVSKDGGIARATSLLTDSLHKTGLYEIHIIGYSKGDDEIGYNWNPELTYHHLLEHLIPMKKGIFKATLKLRKIIKSRDLDLVIACSSIIGPMGVLATMFGKTKLIYWDHSSFFENTAHDFILQGKKFTARFSNAVVPLTKHDEKNYEKHTSAKKIAQIYNPIDVRLEGLSHDYNHSSKKIISVGRLTFLKNFELLADVAKIVFEQCPAYTWHIFGGGESEQSIKKRIADNGISDKLILKGHATDLYAIYPDYALMVMTSRSEGFPMTLLEGMANKIPLISFDIISGPNEIIEPGKNGYLIEPLHVEAMASSIIELLNDEDKRKAFAERNMDYVDRFSMNSVVENWKNLIHNL
ncbi:glycosyltransferase [Maribacter sp. R77961]|uniref:glycosyltransferase n=1 Tax=Maribacter sp. R77961 TaxID=3093871 RepID=UPI0037CCA3FD